VCRRKLPLIGRNEWKRRTDRILNNDRGGEVNSVKRSNIVAQDDLFRFGQNLRYRLHKLPKRSILFHARKNRIVVRPGDFTVVMPAAQS